MFLTDAYFQGELALPNIKRSGPSVGASKMLETVHQKSLEWFIAKYEPMALKAILGDNLYEAFIEGFNGSPEDKWSDLAQRIFWNDTGLPMSPVANYVYYWIMRDANTETTMKGEVRRRESYADNASAKYKMCKAWNDMCPQIRSIRSFILDNWNVYGPYAGNKGCFITHCSYMHPFGLLNTFGI